ncbi:MAG: HemK2/MTQ2 family protein methyltransferase [Candidatus Micrarchaeia archaeon]
MNGDMKTACFKNVEVETPQNVYEPLEDSMLLARLVEKHATGRVLDLGCGSGLQAVIAAKLPQVKSVLAVDLNNDAVACSKKNAEKNGVSNKTKFKKSDLFSNVGKERFETIIFNPPYLPTTEDEQLQKEINLAFDGGPDGRKAINKFLLEFDEFLAPKGVVLMVQSSLADEQKTLDFLGKKGFKAQKMEEEKFFFEKIVSIKAEKQS